MGIKNSDENILDDQYLLDCHRKELVGAESAKEILFAINLNLSNLLDEFGDYENSIYKTSLVIPFNVPLDTLETIFDFWLGIYKDREAWETCLGLLKMRKKVSLSNLIKYESLKGNSKKWALVIEGLHSYKPNLILNKKSNEPMWK